LHHAKTITNVIYMLRLVGISYKLEESATILCAIYSTELCTERV